MKKLFGGIKLKYSTVIIIAVLAGVYTGVVNQIPFLNDTSFTDIAVNMKVWVLFGIFILWKW